MVDLGRKMTLKQARERALEVAKAARDERCRLDHQQLADWLSELETKDTEIARLKGEVAALEEALTTEVRKRMLNDGVDPELVELTNNKIGYLLMREVETVKAQSRKELLPGDGRGGEG